MTEPLPGPTSRWCWWATSARARRAWSSGCSRRPDRPCPSRWSSRGGPETSVASDVRSWAGSPWSTPLDSRAAAKNTTKPQAVEAARGAAVLVVVLNINLLIGDTALLTELLRGSARIAGKGARWHLRDRPHRRIRRGPGDRLRVTSSTGSRRKEAEWWRRWPPRASRSGPDQVVLGGRRPVQAWSADRTDVTSASYSNQNRGMGRVRSFPRTGARRGRARPPSDYAQQ